MEDKKKRFAGAASIRRKIIDRKKEVYNRPEEDPRYVKARERMASKSLTPGLDADIEAHNKRLREKKKEKTKKGFFSKLLGK